MSKSSNMSSKKQSSNVVKMIPPNRMFLEALKIATEEYNKKNPDKPLVQVKD